MSNWCSDMEEYYLVVHLENKDSIYAILKGYSEENALEAACYMPIISLNNGTKDEFIYNAITYLTITGTDIPHKEFRDIMYKVRDGKIHYELEKYSKV